MALDKGSLAGLRMHLSRCCPSEGADGAVCPAPDDSSRGRRSSWQPAGWVGFLAAAGAGGECSLTLPLAAHLAELHDQSRARGGSSWRGFAERGDEPDFSESA